MSPTWSKVRVIDSLPTNAKEVLSGLHITPEGEVYTVKHYTNMQKATDTTRIIHKHLGTKKNGYKYVIHNKKSHLIHRLVSFAFIPNPHDKPHVNHKDGVKSNNHVSNLEWVTRSENEIHARDTGLSNANHLKRKVNQLDLMGNYVKEHASLTEAVKSLGLKPTQKTNISLCCRGKLKTSCGYRWQYA